MNGHWRVVECLVVCVAEYKRHIVDTLTIHVVDGIATTTSDANHLDDAVFLLRCSEVQNLNIVIVHELTIYEFTIYCFTFSIFHFFILPR